MLEEPLWDRQSFSTEYGVPSVWAVIAMGAILLLQSLAIWRSASR